MHSIKCIVLGSVCTFPGCFCRYFLIDSYDLVLDRLFLLHRDLVERSGCALQETDAQMSEQQIPGVREADLPKPPAQAPKVVRAEPFQNLPMFVRHVFSWVMNWDAHYFLPITMVWVGPESTNWVCRFYMKCPF